MSDLGFGLWITALGMGSVFLLLILLMLVLMGIGKWDRRSQAQRAAEPEPAAANVLPADGQWPDDLSDEEVAAICVAVIAHARNRRLQAAPDMRRSEPGSQLFASRWVAVGRGQQNVPWRRTNS